MDQVKIANILLTRRCNLNCSYCNIVKNYKSKPDEYPDMRYYYDNELSGERWIEIFRKILANNDKCFFVIYGGEPFVYKDLNKIIKFCNDNNVYYTIISNNTDAVQSRIYEIYDECGPYKGFTSSVDPIALLENVKDDDIYNKSNVGLNRLIEMKNSGMIEDTVAEITVMNSTIQYLYDLVRILTQNNIYSSITTLDYPKNQYYDFANGGDSHELLTKNAKVFDIFNELYKDKHLFIHIPQLLMKLYHNLPCDYKCNLNEDLHNITIDSDGSFRLCLRIKGTHSYKLSLDQILNQYGAFKPAIHNSIKLDYERHCEGCNWTCPMMTQYFDEGDIQEH